jgi:PAS domain-containing protein
MNDIPPAALDEPRLRLIVDSFRRLTGRPLLEAMPDDARELALALWNAPRAVVAHDTDADPVFFYGNRLALQQFEMSFEEFTQLPSRLSAEAPVREERARLLQQVSERGYVDDYAGMRIAKSGRRFMITSGTVWNLVDEAGVYRGQAATFVVR